MNQSLVKSLQALAAWLLIAVGGVLLGGGIGAVALTVGIATILGMVMYDLLAALRR